ncbi:MAG: flagellar motor protein MotB [Bryobacteraceae bacterium]
MKKKVKHPAHENHERWLVSYADFITLLFAFFVVMFASSQADKSKAKQMSESVKSAFEDGHFSATMATILGGTVDDKGKGNAQMKGAGGEVKISPPVKMDHEKLAELMPSLRRLTTDLKKEIAEGKIQLTLEHRGLVISLKQAAFFPSGEDGVAENLYASIEKVAEVIKKIPNPVRLEGHTDAVPIHNSRYRSNWELSAARSIAMLEILNTRFGVSRSQMAISAYADSKPVASNDDEAGRAQNRRVDILIMNERGAQGEPGRKE